MLDIYDLDVLGSEARGLGYYVAARVPKSEWDNNADMKILTLIERELLQIEFAPYLDFNAISDEISKIRKKYHELPHIGNEIAKAAEIRKNEKLVA